MTQINEGMKIGEIKIFFPNSVDILRTYQLDDEDVEDLPLKDACSRCKVDALELISKLSRWENQLFLDSYHLPTWF